MANIALRNATGLEPTMACPEEHSELEQLAELLKSATADLNSPCRLKLVAPDGQSVELPESVFHLIQRVVPHLRRGQAVVTIPLHTELTTQEAADLLNVSRPFLIGLLDRQEIPYVKTGTHRRIRFDDLIAYMRIRDTSRRQALDRLTRLSQEYGLDAYED